MAASNEDVWENFLLGFMAKMESADFQSAMDGRLSTSISTNAGLPHSPKHRANIGPMKPGIPKPSLGKTFQRRRSKTGDELRNQVNAAALTTPRNNNKNGEMQQSSFFMTDVDIADETATSVAAATVAATVAADAPANVATVATVLSPQHVTNLNTRNQRQASVLRSSINTGLRQASIEKNRPIPRQFEALATLLERLQSSRDEQKAFFGYVEQIIHAKGARHFVNVVKSNRELCSTFTRDNKHQKLKDLASVRDTKILIAKAKLSEQAKLRINMISQKLQVRENKKREEVLQREHTERVTFWLSLIQHGRYVQKVKPIYDREKDARYLQSKEKVLANKIINMWKVKQAPTQGKKYRQCVKKLRSFIKNKTSQWKQTQRIRAVDLMVLFLREHKRANLPIVVANFIHGVKTWQRFWRSFDHATSNRVKALMTAWDEIEAEWFSEREAAIHADAEHKKRMEQEFDLDIMLGEKQNTGPNYTKVYKKPRKKYIAPPPPTPISRRSVLMKSPRSPNVTNGNRIISESPRGKKLNSPTKSGGPKKSKLNVAQTSLIIDMRLAKDLEALHERKPSTHVKRELLRQKLREIRYKYKVSLPGVTELLSRDDITIQKVCTIKDVKNLLDGKYAVAKEQKMDVVSKRKIRKFPQRSKCIHLFSNFVTRDLMKSWVAEACATQGEIVDRRKQNLIDEAHGIVPLYVDTEWSSSEEEDDGWKNDEEYMLSQREKRKRRPTKTSRKSKIEDPGTAKARDDDKAKGADEVRDVAEAAKSESISQQATSQPPQTMVKGHERLSKRRGNITSISLITHLSQLKDNTKDQRKGKS